ncbi:MAG TPA: UDP-N-acetylmuramate dehydrogenase [Candidatus Saccharimonadales bacterium]|nr:UDP-N-acetylmuramate dehydrogenase [Candidatus Saccharimonadales bacterium]
MHSRHNVPLSELTTMRLGGLARLVVTAESADELKEVVSACAASEQPFFVLGGGSNVIARDQEFAGTVILNRVPGFEVIEEDDKSATIKVGAGELWDDVVARSVDMNLSGIEALSAIPGMTGATPVQNVGAYGQEIADSLIELEALDTDSMELVTLANKDCSFSYRHSIFKDPATRHHIITSITLKLTKSQMKPPFYTSLQNYFEKNDITDFSPANVRQAVRAIRAVKLPDPAKVANTGSFFKNPIVEQDKAERLAANYQDMPQFAVPGVGVKLAAGWLIEQSGLKGYANHGFTTSPDNALVVINKTADKYTDLELFKDEIIAKVKSKFGVTLEQEPETL